MLQKTLSITAKWHDFWRVSKLRQIVILDNRDSFVFNLAHRLFEVGETCAVVRSDRVTIADLEKWSPSALVISPGPGHPDDAGVSVEAVRHFGERIPILGVCLGHQAIARAFGAQVVEGGRPMHGMASAVEHDSTGIFEGLPEEFEAARYHSLVARGIPTDLVENAWAEGFIMGLRHRRHPIQGVQFHPESILTPAGSMLLENFVKDVRRG